jgi:predicted Zn finger-like uncharacterized protein
MEYQCPDCKSIKHIIETIKIGATGEIVNVVKCANCGTVIDASIKRPKGLTLKKIRGAGEIRFSENEKRNFATMALSIMEIQNKILVAMATGESKEKIIKLSENPLYFQSEYKSVIGLDDSDYS